MPLDRGSGRFAWLVSGLTLALVLSPLLRPAASDSFPFSSYPMFAFGRPDAVTGVTHLIAIDAAGHRRPVPPAKVANDEVLQADVTLRRAARGGKKTAAALCRAVAVRLADDPAWSDAITLELVSEKFDALRYFDGDRTPLKPPRVHVRCEVRR